jgi:protein-tyrosine phosphatase
MKNFRDVGGSYTQEGRKVKCNLLFRSANFDSEDDSEVQLLRQKNITQIIDLRSSFEIRQNPYVKIRGINYNHLPILEKTIIPIIDRKAKRNPFQIVKYVLFIESYTRKTYKSFISAEFGYKNLVTIFEILLNQGKKQSATLIHCNSGKDRTGFVIALLLKILDVKDNAILSDYLTTNDFLREIQRKHIPRHSFFRKKIALIFFRIKGHSFLLKENYLRLVFKEVDKKFGTFEAFENQGLALPSQKIESLIEYYTEA